MHTISLNGTWDVRHEALSLSGDAGAKIVTGRSADWLQAVVPGEVHLDLCRAGQLPEPLHSLNARECRWPEDRSWWYRKTFDASAEFLANELLELVCEGVDYYGQFFLNGKFIGESENALVPVIFDISGKLIEGANELLVRVTVGTERAANQQIGESTAEKPYGHRQSFYGLRELRKPQFSYGWDWVETLPNIGICREVSLRGYSGVRVTGVQQKVVLSTDHHHAQVFIVAEVENLHPWAEREVQLMATLVAPDGKEYSATCQFIAQSGYQEISLDFSVCEPELWWPNGMGGQPLYALRLVVLLGDQQMDAWERRIGLRTVSIDRSPLPEGHRFAIQINGRDVFCRGGNWIPADAIISRAGANKLEALVRSAAEAHFTMLRVWGGGVYEDEAFYDACDRHGIMIWQDFLFACSLYPDRDLDFQTKVRNEAESVVRRLRTHPCVALWCGNNENTSSFPHWNWNSKRTWPSHDMVLDGSILYNKVLPEVCARLDSSRPYWPGSPYGGFDPNSETEGDCHWWGPGTMNESVERRYRHEIYDECRSRFVSEYGVIGPCHMASYREALKSEEIGTSSPAMMAHTNTFEKNTTPEAIRYHYADPESLDFADYIRYGQMFQAWMYGHSLEALRFRAHDPVDDCQGALIWMFNDCWCETGWTPIDYSLRRKASYYWIKNALYPVRAIVRKRGENLVTRLINDSGKAVEATVFFGWLPVDGRAQKNRLTSLPVKIVAGAMQEIATEPIPLAHELPPSQWIYAAWCEGENIEPTPSVWTLCPHRQMSPALAPINIQVAEDGKTLTLTCPVYCHGVAYADEGARIFSDNYFDLLPGIPKRIQCLQKNLPQPLLFEGIKSVRV